MLKQERHARILHQLDVHNKVLIGDLCNLLQVSKDTIRRDLQELDEAGRLVKVHGGAISKVFNHIVAQPIDHYSHEKKSIIAEKTLSLIKDDMFILTSGGTTILEIVNILSTDLNATFITGSIPVVNILSTFRNIKTIVIGGVLSKDSKLTTGGLALETLQTLNADLCILGVNSIDAEKGITDIDDDIVTIKKAMIQSAKKVACVAIAEKLDTVQPLQIASLDKIDYLITELDPSSNELLKYKQLGIEIL